MHCTDLQGHGYNLTLDSKERGVESGRGVLALDWDCGNVLDVLSGGVEMRQVLASLVWLLLDEVGVAGSVEDEAVVVVGVREDVVVVEFGLCVAVGIGGGVVDKAGVLVVSVGEAVGMGVEVGMRQWMDAANVGVEMILAVLKLWVCVM